MKHKPLEEQTAEELRAYVGELRSENKDIREVFGAYSPNEQRGITHMLRLLKEDRIKGAELFKEMAEDILGTPTQDEPEEIPMSEETEEPTTPPADDSTAPAWFSAFAEKLEQVATLVTQGADQSEQQAIEEIKQEARSLGYKDGTPEWDNFFKLAANLTDGDLNAAHEAYGKLHGPLGTGDGEEGDEGEAEAPAPKFPKAASAGGSGAPAPGSTDEAKKPTTDARSLREQARAYIDAVSDDGVATP